MQQNQDYKHLASWDLLNPEMKILIKLVKQSAEKVWTVETGGGSLLQEAGPGGVGQPAGGGRAGDRGRLLQCRQLYGHPSHLSYFSLLHLS